MGMLCLLQVKYYYFTLAYDRIYIDARAETENLENMRTKINLMVKYIIRGFRSMVDQVSWLTPKTHERALKKLDNIALNLLYKNISMDSQKLDEYYKALDFDNNTPIGTMMDSLRKFRYDNQLAQLVMDTADRHDFGKTIDEVEAWYSAFTNSINIPLGILQKPIFAANWPMEYSCGVLSFTLGHEISHGFGIHAAFRGFEHWKDTVGKEPGLPSTEGTLGNLKNDQLFFLAQSQMSCRKKCEYSPDVHSPARSRIQGSLSNFSAFHNAFDCKVGDVYRPKEKCDVWIT